MVKSLITWAPEVGEIRAHEIKDPRRDVLSVTQIQKCAASVREIGQLWTKSAAVAEKSFSLTGILYLSQTGWLLLSVPNMFVRGAFDAIHEKAIELPLDENGRLNAHISVMSPDEVEEAGGADAITERGHQFSYSLGPLREVSPHDWRGVSKVWYITVDSPELRDLRRSYGLPPLRRGFDHHITVAIRKIHSTKAATLAPPTALPASIAGTPSSAMPFSGDSSVAIPHVDPVDVNQAPPVKSQLQLDLANASTAADARANFEARLRAFLANRGRDGTA